MTTTVSSPVAISGNLLKCTVTAQGTLPYAITQHAVVTTCHFPAPLTVTPKAAWLADYVGSDCAEAIWIIRNVTTTTFELWGLNCCSRDLGCNFKVNLIIAH